MNAPLINYLFYASVNDVDVTMDVTHWASVDDVDVVMHDVDCRHRLVT